MAKKQAKPVKKAIKFNRPTLIVLVVILALIGAVIILRASAATPDMSNLVLDYQVGGTASGSKKADGSWTMTQQPVQTQITNNGELICNAGNPDSMNTAQLSQAEVDKITTTVRGHLSTIKEEMIGQSDGQGGTFVLDPTTITLAKSGKVEKAVSVDSSAPKPGGLTSAENFLKQTCKKATKAKPLADLPLIEGSSRVGSIVAGIAGAAIPDAYAVATTPRPDSESIMLYNTNGHRGNDARPFGLKYPTHPLNKFAYPATPCLKKAARAHSTWMATNGFKHHPNPFPWLASFCGGNGPTAWAENIYGWAGPTNTTEATLTTVAASAIGAWLNSNGHHLNIDGGDFRAAPGGQAANEFNRIGNGAMTFIAYDEYAKKNVMRLYLTQEFVHCDATCGGNSNYDK